MSDISRSISDTFVSNSDDDIPASQIPSSVQIVEEEPGTLVQLVFGDITKMSAIKQLAIGGAAGWVAGFFVRRGEGRSEVLDRSLVKG